MNYLGFNPKLLLFCTVIGVVLLAIAATAVFEMHAMTADASYMTADHVPQELPADLT